MEYVQKLRIIHYTVYFLVSPMQLEDLRVFHSIVETGGFVKASQTLNLPKSTLSRRIKNIESKLGVRLFNRNNRGTQITVQGERYYQKTKSLLQELEQINNSMTPEQAELEGQLRIKIPSDLSFLIQTLLEFSKKHPNVQLDIITDNNYLDLNANRLDFSFEADELPPTRYIARHLADFKLEAVCSPDYVKNHGRPKTFSDLSKHNTVLFRNANGEVERSIKIGRRNIKLSGNLIMATATQMILAAIQGMGITFMPRIVTQTAMDKGLLIDLFPDKTIQTVPFHMLYPSREYVSPVARQFIDFVIEQFKQSPNEAGFLSNVTPDIEIEKVLYGTQCSIIGGDLEHTQR